MSAKHRTTFLRKPITLTLACLVLASTSHAATVYSDGGTHVIDGNGPTGDVTASRGSTLDIRPGASLGYVQVEGSSVFDVPGSHLAMSGGTIATNLQLGAGSSASISGGSLTGGDSVDAFGGSLTITGGSFRPTAADGFSIGFYTSFANPTPATLLITGGTFDHAVIVSLQGPAARVQFSPPSPAADSPSLVITGGTFTGGPMSISAIGGAVATISGGTFAVPSIAVGTSQGSHVTFFGTGLSYAGGLLTGTLADGTPIRELILGQGPFPLMTVAADHLTFGPDPGPAIDLAPEPSSLVMGSIAAVVLAFVARKRRGIPANPHRVDRTARSRVA